jgi:hypothetical protein
VRASDRQAARPPVDGNTSALEEISFFGPYLLSSLFEGKMNHNLPNYFVDIEQSATIAFLLENLPMSVIARSLGVHFDLR